jgi:hypothetical protein
MDDPRVQALVALYVAENPDAPEVKMLAAAYVAVAGKAVEAIEIVRSAVPFPPPSIAA